LIREDDINDLLNSVRRYVASAADREEMLRRWRRIYKMTKRCGRCQGCLEADVIRREMAEKRAMFTGYNATVALQLKEKLSKLRCEADTD
jgi:hypothetical protein